jgi:sugar lactone lactonase YvrE
LKTAKDIAFEVISHSPSYLAEGPIWDEQKQAILWVDILNGKILEFNLERKQVGTLEFDEPIGAVALFPDGDLLAAMQSGIYSIKRGTTDRTFLCHPESGNPTNRYNDGKCDPYGRFWIGSMAQDHKQGAGNLFTVYPNLKCNLQRSGVSISNGLAWSNDHKTLYYIDSPTRCIQAFDYNAESGTISNARVAFEIPEKEGVPDGMTIDSEGMLWIAHWDGWQVARWNPKTGEKLLGYKLPAAQITSCAFGGENLEDLYITSAREGLTDQDITSQPLAGSVFVIRNCGYKGWETPRVMPFNTAIQ